MNLKLSIFLISIFISFSISSQDTFSIVALDSITGEVGSAGASCVDMNFFPGYSDDFLGELFPGVGAINTQAWYNQSNQINARNRMNQGDTPSEIIQWLVDNDIQNQPGLRQYGIVAMVNGSAQSAAHTGVNTDNYKNHITGPNYSIQGNILLGPEILEAMEVNFLNTEGDLACKLMAALQGANVIGADTRCASNGTSSLFAFAKVAQPGDTFGNPSFVLSLRTSDGAGIEPIDSLQSLFDDNTNCVSLGIDDHQNYSPQLFIYPNPASDFISIELNKSNIQWRTLRVIEISGREVLKVSSKSETPIDVSFLPPGLYTLLLAAETGEIYSEKLIIE